MLKISPSYLLIFLATLIVIQANRFADESVKSSKIFEGDMLLSPELQRAIKAGKRSRRNALIDRQTHWPSGVVYYVIDQRFSEREKNMIKEAMHHISSQTCIRFRQFKRQTSSYVHIRPGPDGCYSTVGYARGRINILNLKPLSQRGSHCFTKGIIVHEFLHSLGIFHQHSAPDRDRYIRIIAENIQRGKASQFKKYPHNVVNDYNVGYDYSSIMHYGLDTFSKNGRRTMQPTRQVDERVIGQRERLSSKDVAKINRMYNCKRA